MASGKVAKRRRREAEAPRPARRASPKVLVGAAAATAVAIAAIFGVVALTGNDGGSAVDGESTTLSGVSEVARLYRGIPQSGTTLGRPSAPVTLVEYIDLQCPFCRQFVTEAFPTLVERYVRPGKVRVEMRGLAFIGPDSVRGMRAAHAAAAQNRMYQFIDLLYINQGDENGGWLSEEMVRQAATAAGGIDVDRLLTDAGSSAVTDKLAADDAKAQADAVTGTPTILVGPAGGTQTQVRLQSAGDLASIEQAIAAAGG